MELEVKKSTVDGIPVLAPAGEIDVWTAERLKMALQDVETSAGKSDIVVDLGAVDFIDSTGIGVLVGALRRRREVDASLHLVTEQPNILKILSITNLDTVFEVHATLPQAIETAAAR